MSECRLLEFVERDYQWHHSYPRRGWSHEDWTLLTLASHGCDVCRMHRQPLLQRVDRWVCLKCSGLDAESIAEFTETHQVDVSHLETPIPSLVTGIGVSLDEEAVMTMPIPTRSMPECWECGYKSLFEEHFVLGDDDVFRCNVCDDEYKKDCNGESIG